jgi:hypothetical protein
VRLTHLADALQLDLDSHGAWVSWFVVGLGARRGVGLPTGGPEGLDLDHG